jgi:hypothetical protein
MAGWLAAADVTKDRDAVWRECVLGAAPPLTHSHVELTQSWSASQPGDAILGLFVNDELKSSLKCAVAALWKYTKTPAAGLSLSHFRC